jgi:hypothetical protein
LSSLPAVANTRWPSAVANWIAVVPMPELPPCTSSVSPALRLGAVEHIAPDGEVVLGQRRRLEHADALGDRQALLASGAAQYSA